MELPEAEHVIRLVVRLINQVLFNVAINSTRWLPRAPRTLRAVTIHGHIGSCLCNSAAGCPLSAKNGDEHGLTRYHSRHK